MSYKLDLSGIDREGPTSITQQLVGVITDAIEHGKLEPGEKLPTTRALAARFSAENQPTPGRKLRAAAEDTTGTVVAAVSALALLVAALWLQHCCISPQDPPEHGEGAES